jgi:hypothetical protein
MEAADRSGISQGEGVRARPGRLRELRRRYDLITARHAEAGLRRAAAIPQTVEASRGQPEIALGRRSHCARRGRRRAVRSLEYEDTLPAVPRRSNGGFAVAAPFGAATVAARGRSPETPLACARGSANPVPYRAATARKRLLPRGCQAFKMPCGVGAGALPPAFRPVFRDADQRGECCGNRGLLAADDAEQKLGGSAEAPPHKCHEGYFLKSLSKASRASLALRGGGVFIPAALAPPGSCVDEASRATVTRGENVAQSFCWSLTGMRTRIGFVH